MLERTCAIVKPDAVAAGYTGDIIAIIEECGFDIIAMEKKHLSKKDAEAFYAVHKARPFFGELVSFMTSGPVVVMALEKEDAIQDWRELMGATDPEKAEEGTIRKEFGTNVGENATHGSDSAENAVQEIAFFFPNLKK